MKTRSIITAIAIAFILIGCKAIKKSQNLRTDGVYYFHKNKSQPYYYECYRFYSDGTVILGYFEQTPSEIWADFKKEQSPYYHAKYRIKKNHIKMTFYSDLNKKSWKLKGELQDNLISLTKYSYATNSNYIHKVQMNVDFIKLE